MFKFSFQEEVISVRERRYPTAIDQRGIPADMIDVEMGTDDNIDIFRLEAAPSKFPNEVRFEVVKWGCTWPLLIISATCINDDRRAFRFND